VMGARLAVGIIAFIASDEGQALKDELFNHPYETITKFVKLAIDLFDPSDLWEYLLFGNLPGALTELHADKTPPQPTSASKSIGQKIRRVLARLYRLGKAILGAVARMQTHLRWRVERA